jgi:hypothetical protein
MAVGREPSGAPRPRAGRGAPRGWRARPARPTRSVESAALLIPRSLKHRLGPVGGGASRRPCAPHEHTHGASCMEATADASRHCVESTPVGPEPCVHCRTLRHAPERATSMKRTPRPPAGGATSSSRGSDVRLAAYDPGRRGRPSRWKRWQPHLEYRAWSCSPCMGESRPERSGAAMPKVRGAMAGSAATCGDARVETPCTGGAGRRGLTGSGVDSVQSDGGVPG